MFGMMLWGGATLSIMGLAGLFWCIFRVVRARRSGLKDDELRSIVQGVIPINLGALALSVIGLMLVIAGIALG